MSDEPSIAVLIPIKSFAHAKGRLSESLSVDDRGDLAREMASRVIAAASPLPTWVVCHDHEVASWAMATGVHVAWRARQGLNEAVQAGVAFLGRLGFRRVIVAHGDLPLATDIVWTAAFDGVTIVPDRRGEGTNVLCVPTEVAFDFAYGPGSAAKHRAEALRRDLPVRVVEDELLGWDVDTPDDLDVFERSG